jgi:FKBP-type peptidyl-prolyl cis-trans isomerase
MNKQTSVFIICAVAFLVLGGVLYASRENNALLVVEDKKPSTMETQIPGLQIEIIKEGSGEGIKNGQTAVVHYTGTLTDGKVFDSSIPRGQTFPVHLGRGEVIKGWDFGLVGMKVGEKRKLTIAPELAYGKRGIPGVIPESAVLIFEVSLEAIQ